MNDEELADRIVALGVGEKDETIFPGREWKYRLDDKVSGCTAYVRDWRVVGALIEKCQKIYIEYIGDPEQTVYARAEDNRTWDWIDGESLPRTINEACCEALNSSNGTTG